MLCNDCIEGISSLNSGEITIRGDPSFYTLKQLQRSGTYHILSICNVTFRQMNIKLL
jgi:hypothetical protein